VNTDDPDDPLARVLSRLDDIEARLRALEAGRTLRTVASAPAAAPVPPPPPPPSPVPESEPTPPARPEFETRVGLTWLNRIGVLTVVLGVAFFFKYAIDKGLIGETGRVVLGVAVGLAALALAEFMSRRGHRVYAQGITGAGISILYLSLYSSFGFYHLLPQLVVFGLMFLTTVAAVALALYYNAIAIAALGLIGGYLTPLVLSTNEDRPWMLFSYIFILGAGGMELVGRRKWRLLEPLLLAGTSLVYFLWFVDHFRPGKEWVATVSALALYALFWQSAGRRILIGAQALGTLAILAAWRGQIGSLWFNLLLGTAGLAAAHRRKSFDIATAAFSAFWFAAAAWHLRDSRIFSPAGLAVITVAMFLFLAFAIRQLSRYQDNSHAPPSLLAILGVDGLAYFGICYFILEAGYRAYLGPGAAAMAAIHFGVAWFLWKRPAAPGRDNTPILVSVGVATAFVTLAIPIQFSQYRITMGWALEGALFTWIASRTGNRRFGAAAIAIFALAFARVALVDAASAQGRARLLTFVVTGVGYWLGSRWMEQDIRALLLYLSGHFVALWGLLLTALDWAGQQANAASVAVVSVSVLLAAYGVVMVVLGVTLGSLVNRYIGLALLAAVILKLYFFDVWQLQQTFRVVAFVALGLLLLTASFLYSRFRPVIGKLWDRNST
jgi:uncharacterized membrane protein